MSGLLYSNKIINSTRDFSWFVETFKPEQYILDPRETSQSLCRSSDLAADYNSASADRARAEWRHYERDDVWEERCTHVISY